MDTSADPHAGQSTEGESSHSAASPGLKRRQVEPRTLLLLTAAACCVAVTAAWLQWRSLASAQDAFQVRSESLARMRADAERISELREAPRQAADRQKPNDELLGQVEQALRQANVPVELWQDSIPQPAQRLANSPYLQHSTRLYFDGIKLEQVLNLAYQLMQTDPSLSVSSLHLGAPGQADKSFWNGELTLSYLVFQLSSE